MQRADFENLIPEMKLGIYRYLEYKDLCHLSQVSKQEDSLACDPALWRSLVRSDFYCDSTSNVHPKLFYQNSMGLERDIYVAFHQAVFLEGILEDGGYGSMFALRRAQYYSRFANSQIPFLQEIRKVITNLKAGLKDSDLREFEDGLSEATRNAKDEYNTLLNRPDELNANKFKAQLNLLCLLDAHHTLAAVCQKNMARVDMVKLLWDACGNFNVNTIKKLIELGVDLNSKTVIPGNDERKPLFGNVLVSLIFDVERLILMATPRGHTEFMECFQKLVKVVKLLLDNGVDSDAPVFATLDNGVSFSGKGGSLREFCRALYQMMDEGKDLTKEEQIFKQISKIVADFPKKQEKLSSCSLSMV